MSSVAQAFSKWMSQYIFSKNDIEYMIEVAEKANNFFEGKADTKEIINKLEDLKEMLEMENE